MMRLTDRTDVTDKTRKSSFEKEMNFRLKNCEKLLL